MANTTARPKKSGKIVSKTKKNSKAPKNKVVLLIARIGRNRFAPVAAIVIFALIGSYLVFFSSAMSPDEILLPDQSARGLVFNGNKIKNKGQCKGGFDLTSPDDIKRNGKDNKKCAHFDAGPVGQDVRKRADNVDSILANMAKKDASKKTLKGDEPTPANSAATISGADMSDLGGRALYCYGDGSSGPRVQALYVYPQGSSNRLSTLRPGFSAISRRVNQIFFASGEESGNTHQVRFQTFWDGNGGCDLSITAVAIPAEYLHDFTHWAQNKDGSYSITYSGIDRALERLGYASNDRKYMVWVDYKTDFTPCGTGTFLSDTKPTQDNLSNTRTGYAVAWKGCWNYAEPHELMHNLGAVQYVSSSSHAPYATPGHHCSDEDDVMCYNDSNVDGIGTFSRCKRDIDKWRLDCAHDTYYRGANPTSGWLSNHWNTANSRFLTP